MDVYVLDSLYRRQTVVDNFESFIWTERFSAYGDFQMIVYSTPGNRTLFTVGLHLALDVSYSYRVMTVETIENSTDTSGNAIITIKGRSLEAILEDRVARSNLDGTTGTPKWSLYGLPVDIAKQIFSDICISGWLNSGDIIPGMFMNSGLFPADTIPYPTDLITYDIDPKTLYVAETELCNLFKLGFRIVKNYDTSQLFFDIYSGCDRTTRQTTLPAVVFSTDLDNLQNTAELTSIAAYKNVAHVISAVGTSIVYAPNIDPAIAGFDRRVLVVNATDITDTDTTIAASKRVQRGAQELAKYRHLWSFDGQLAKNSQYKYGVDYNLGDIVELRNEDGVISSMQVTEQIFTSDKSGESSYPTLTIQQFIMPGTWLAQPPAQNWADRTVTTDVWGTQP